jgi:hypothetical protein
LIRRVVGGKQRGKHSGVRPESAPTTDIIDLGTPSDALALARIERLEKGTRLLAETVKLTYERMRAAIEDLRHQAARAASLDEVQRLVAATARRLNGDGAARGPSEGRVVPVLPLEAERAGQAPDALTALRRARFDQGEPAGP